MPLYEHVYLARQDLSTQQVEELTAKLSGVIAEGGGKITKTEYWGMKSLNYRIRKNRKAHMTLLNVDAPPAALNEIERHDRLNEDALAADAGEFQRALHHAQRRVAVTIHDPVAQ